MKNAGKGLVTYVCVSLCVIKSPIRGLSIPDLRSSILDPRFPIPVFWNYCPWLEVGGGAGGGSCIAGRGVLRKTQYGGGRGTFDRQRKKNCPSRLHFFGMYHCAERENCRYRKWIRFESHDVRSKGEFKPHATQRIPAEIGRFYTRGRIIRLDELGQTVLDFLLVWLCVSSINTGTRRI